MKSIKKFNYDFWNPVEEPTINVNEQIRYIRQVWVCFFFLLIVHFVRMFLGYKVINSLLPLKLSLMVVFFHFFLYYFNKLQNKRIKLYRLRRFKESVERTRVRIRTQNYLQYVLQDNKEKLARTEFYKTILQSTKQN